MVGVFSIFGTLSLLEFKQLGVGLAAAVLIDATIVRAVLLPAAMTRARPAQLVAPGLARPEAAGCALTVTATASGPLRWAGRGAVRRWWPPGSPRRSQSSCAGRR
jgi:RND superfamily putative drug exporter